MAQHAADDRPDVPNLATKGMADNLTIVRDLMRGTAHIRSRSKVYLPLQPREDSKDYDMRLNRTPFFNAFARTVAAHTGLVFQRDLVLGADYDTKILEWSESIDQRGTHISVFGKELLSDMIQAGHAAILIDVPVAPQGRLPGGRLSIGEELAGNIRPYFVHIRAEDIVSWRSFTDGAREILNQVVLREETTEPKGEFREESVTRYRVYNRVVDGSNRTPTVTWSLLELDGTSGVFLTIDSGTIKNVTEIPLVGVYANRTGLLQSIPPLLDLAYTNIAHYQVLADSLQALSMASSPMLSITGMATDEELAVGPNRAIMLADPTARAQWIETSGAALNASRQQLTDFEAQMAALGLSLLHKPGRQVETAEAKRLDRAEQDSALGTTARSLEDGLENAFGFIVQMAGLEDGGSVQVNRDFQMSTLSAEDKKVWSGLVLADQISHTTFIEKLIRSGELPSDFDIELELDRIENAMFPGTTATPVDTEG